MKFIKLLAATLVLSLFMWTKTAYAATWIYVGEDTSKTIYYYDADTIQRSGSQVVFWSKRDHSKDRSVRYRETKVLNRYDCSARTYTILSGITIYPDGSTESDVFPPYDQTVSYVAPETLAERFLEIVCGSS